MLMKTISYENELLIIASARFPAGLDELVLDGNRLPNGQFLLAKRSQRATVNRQVKVRAFLAGRQDCPSLADAI